MKKAERDSMFFKKQRELYKKSYQKKANIYQYEIDESLYCLTRKDKNGTYSATILITEILIMLTSMYKTDFLIDKINHLYLEVKRIKLKIRTITINHLGEKDVLV